MNSSTYQVLLFGALKDAAQGSSISVKAAEELSVQQLLDEIAAQFPALARYLPHVRVAVNCEYSSLETTVNAGDEIALIPPVAGG
jgi:molybdopterin converting factor subunit 1